MSWLALWLVPVVVAPIALLFVVYRRFARVRRIEPLPVVLVVLGGAAALLASRFIDARVLALTGIPAGVPSSLSLLAVVTFVAPLEQATLLAVVWPLHALDRLRGRRVGLLHAFAAGTGAAAANALLRAFTTTDDGWLALRLVVDGSATLFCAGLWGHFLGTSSAARRSRWFATSWLGATLLRALFLHVLYERGPALISVLGPLLAAMALVGWSTLSALSQDEARPPPTRRSLVPAPPSLERLREVLAPSRRGARPLWIGFGTFVTLGAVFSMFGFGVWAGHQLGLDFAAVDEDDVRSVAPIVLLGSSVLAAFPFAGFLLAKASAASSAWEPTVSATAAAVLLAALVVAATPSAIVLVLAVAPVAFVLAGAGAWLGVER